MTHEQLREALEAWRAQGVPVDDERRERLRESTVDQIRTAMQAAAEKRRRRAWVTGALLAALVGVGAAAAVIAVSSALDRSPPASTLVQSELFAQSEDARSSVERAEQHLPLQKTPLALQPGDALHAGPAAAVELALPDAGRATLAANGELQVTRALRAEQRFSLRQGRLEVAIPSEAPHRSLVVTTPHAAVAVVGTVFTVAVRGEGAAAETEVTVARGRVHVIAYDGEERWLDAGDSWRSSERAVTAAAADDSTRASSEIPAPSAARRAAPVRGGEPVGAAANLSALPEQNRLYRQALDARNAGDDARAIALLDSLIARHPGSPLRQEAEVERFRALSRIGRTAEAVRAARRYLSDYETGFARDEAETLALPSARPTP